MARGSRGILAAGALAALLGVFPAFAQTSEADKTTARVLFDDGRKLVEQKKFDEGCKKLAESNRLDPGAGVQFHLANCYQMVGKTASAWQLFLQVASTSRTEKQEAREKAARDRAAELEPKLMKITIQVGDAAKVQGLAVKRDGSPAAEAVWGSAVPVDPGKHTVEASAPGKKTWTQDIELTKPGQTVSITVPKLEDDAGGGSVQPAATSAPTSTAAATTTATPGQDSAPPARSKRRTVGIIVGAVGLVAAGVGGLAVVAGKKMYDDASTECNDQNVCSQKGYDDRNAGIALADTGGALAVLGGAALITGVVLFATAPKNAPSAAPAATTGLVVGPGRVWLQGSF